MTAASQSGLVLDSKRPRAGNSLNDSGNRCNVGGTCHAQPEGEIWHGRLSIFACGEGIFPGQIGTTSQQQGEQQKANPGQVRLSSRKSKPLSWFPMRLHQTWQSET